MPSDMNGDFRKEVIRDEISKNRRQIDYLVRQGNTGVTQEKQ